MCSARSCRGGVRLARRLPPAVLVDGRPSVIQGNGQMHPGMSLPHNINEVEDPLRDASRRIVLNTDPSANWELEVCSHPSSTSSSPYS